MPASDDLRTHQILLGLIAGGLWALPVALLMDNRPAEADRARVLTRDDVVAAVEQALQRQAAAPGSMTQALALRRLLSNCQILLEERRPEPGSKAEEEGRKRMVGWLRC